MRFGAHVSIAEHLYLAIDRAVAIGCEALQIFPGNPRGWKTRPFPEIEIEEFKKKRRQAGLGPVAIHMPYLVNLGSKSERIAEASISSLKDALIKAQAIEAEFIVMHPGSYGAGCMADGLGLVISGLNRILEEDFGSVKLLLENTAGAGTALGGNLPEIADMIAGTGFDPRVGLCLDTCHAYASGYDLAASEGLDRFMDELEHTAGLDRLLLTHANDCKGELGSHLDRHEHIGRGRIGLEGWRRLVSHPNLADATWIIETPKKDPADDPRNLALLRTLRQESGAI